MGTNTIYTLGIIEKTIDELLSIIASHSIDCVVDIRGESTIYDKEKENLCNSLREKSIHYLPFHDTFGRALPAGLNSKGNIDYSKIIRTEEYSRGLERLENGMSKGFCILVVDNAKQPSESIRYSVIGKFLTDKGYEVIHILPNREHMYQKEVDALLQAKAKQELEKRREALRLGQDGEEIAALHLQQNGYIILDHNWNLHHGCELDIVAMKDNVIHFVEVKTRSNDAFGAPQAAIDMKKMKNLMFAAKEYRHLKHLTQMPYVIDSIAIIYRSDNDYDLQHFEDIRIYKNKYY